MKYLESDGEYRIYVDSSTQSGDEFYRRMGRCFADPGIRKELGGPLTDSPDHTWLLVYRDDELVAFSGWRRIGDIAWFTETYVFPAHRRAGLFTRLFDLKYDLCAAEARVVKGLANTLSRPLFERRGWRVSSIRGSWTYYEKKVEHESGIAI